MTTMAKEQKRGNKEARKPKGDKKKPVAAGATVTSLMAGSTRDGRTTEAKS